MTKQAPGPIDNLEHRFVAAFGSLPPDDQQSALLMIETMRTGIGIELVDIQGKSRAELRKFMDALRQLIEAGGSEN